MQVALRSPLPEPLAVTRSSARAARVGAFALEVWTRLLLEGAAMAPDERARELSWVAENMCAIHGVRPSVRGSVPNQPCLLVANHVSYFDPMIVASLTPCTAVAKREVALWPCVGDLCRRLGVIYVERESALSGARVLREAMRSFERGVPVLVFPEGTTTRGDRVLPFKRGSFGAALHAGVPIVPVALHYESRQAAWVGDDTFLPHYMRTLSKPYTRVSVEVLPALEHARGDRPSDLAERARLSIAQALVRHETARERRVEPQGDVWSLASA
jgi:lyso-ornithine lipid O-acyltransferase